jgi:hypothetical protein
MKKQIWNKVVTLSTMALMSMLVLSSDAKASVNGRTSKHAETAYVWASQPTTASYTSTGVYNYNSKGAPNTIKRVAVGRYEVTLGKLTRLGGTVQVTSYGAGATHCKVAMWSPVTAGMNVRVNCFNLQGIPVDAQYDVRYVN